MCEEIGGIITVLKSLVEISGYFFKLANIRRLIITRIVTKFLFRELEINFCRRVKSDNSAKVVVSSVTIVKSLGIGFIIYHDLTRPINYLYDYCIIRN